MSYCSNCGKEINENDKFCTGCGNDLLVSIANEADFIESSKGSNSDVNMEKRKRTPVFGIISIVIAFVGGVIDFKIVVVVLAIVAIVLAIIALKKNETVKVLPFIAIIFATACIIWSIAHNPSAVVPINTQDTEAVDTENGYLNFSNQAVDLLDNSNVNRTTKSNIDEFYKEESGNFHNVDIELKEFLDSYETFMDEYVEFMKKYKEDPGNALSLAADYIEILGKYEEFSKTIENYNPDDMSPEDAAYYLEVTLRVEKKLLSIL